MNLSYLELEYRILELEKQNKILQYEKYFLQSRLDKIRIARDTLVHILDTPTFPGEIKAPDVLAMVGKAK